LIEVYGIRHHGPGSARSLRAALEAQRPDIVLVEGPPEAGPLLPLAADPGMVPPVALLAYLPGSPGTSACWPFAAFSPEWQAIGYALGAGVPVRFCDLPVAHQLALEPERGRPRRDPIAELAKAGGYDDPERWWEDAVEHVPGTGIFAAIAEAMTELRAPSSVVDEPPPTTPAHSQALEGGRWLIDNLREAAMRRAMRAAVKEGHENVAVVCGAWHVPALTGLGPAAPDDRLLRGLPRCKPELTWIPWTYGRLSLASGYGAGVTSPGWYHHLFSSPGQPVERWLAKAAAVLRDNDLTTSPAHVVEAVRLATALAALRGRPLPGLEEVSEATLAVLCEGSELMADLVRRDLVIGERLGSVPESAPAVPLARDLHAAQRKLRLHPDPVPRDLELDLRQPSGLGRSRLLHRLALLGVDWGVPAEGRNSTGTFRESWRLAWRPELDVLLIEASTWGVTVQAAAVARVRDRCENTAGTLADLAAVTERCLLADLPEAMPAALAAVRSRAALDADVTHLMAALPALARAARYGDVRGTSLAAVRSAAVELLIRVCAGLPAAVVSLDAAASRVLSARIDAVESAASLLDERDRWLETLARLRCPPLIDGHVTRLLFDAGRVPSAQVARRMSAALSRGAPPADTAGWAEGFLSGSGLLLAHDTRLLSLVDDWIAGLSPEAFTNVLPALRRTFGEFAQAHRQAIASRAASLGIAGRAPGAEEPFDASRAAGALALVDAILPPAGASAGASAGDCDGVHALSCTPSQSPEGAAETGAGRG
jgi:hypothetical protein